MPRALPPMPPEFPAHAWAAGVAPLGRQFGVAVSTILRWRESCGPDPRVDLSAPPADFIEKVKTLRRYALAQHYQVSERRIGLWAKKCGIGISKHGPTRAGRRIAPDDLAEMAELMTKTQLMAHYAADYPIVVRWLGEAGIEAVKRAPVMPSRQPVTFRNNPRALIHRDIRQTDMYDDAADVIRRERFAVYRCNERGAYDPKGASWRVGISILTPDELLQRADKYRRRAA